MRYSRKKKIIIISCLAALVLSIGIGFAAFSTTLKINGSAKVTPTDANFKVIFADTAEEGGIYTQLPVIPTSNPSDLEKYDGEIATEGTKISNLGGVFTEDGQSIIYDFFVYNVGKYDAYLTNIEYTYKEGTYSKRTCTNNGASEETFNEACNDIIIKVVLAGETYTGSTIFTDHVLAKGEFEPIQVIIEYPEGSNLPDGDMDVEFSDIELIFGTIDDAHPLPDAALMANPSNVFRFSGITRSQVESIETVSTIDVPYDAIDSCDASAKQDETVIAWYKDEDKDGLYELYIGGEGSIKVTSGESLFANYTNATIIDLTYFDTSKVTTMQSMFAGDSKLESLLIDNFDGSSVTTVQSMFYGAGVEELVLNDFYAPNLNNVNSMFCNAKVRKIEMNNFTAGEVTTIGTWKSQGSGIYNAGLLNVEEISMKNLNMPKVTDASFMFYYERYLKRLDISGINMPLINNTSYMFYYDRNLTEIIGLEDYRTSQVTDMSYMFFSCDKLESLDLSNFDTTNVTTMKAMFNGCNSLNNLDLSSFDTSKVITMESMFYKCQKLTELNINNFDGSSVETMYAMFQEANIDELKLNNFNAPNLNNVDAMFCNAKVRKLEMNNFTAGEVTTIGTWKSQGSGIYNAGLLNVEEISMKNLNMPKVTDASFMFSYERYLKRLDISGINMPLVNNTSYMFDNCISLIALDLSTLNFSNVTNFDCMFRNVPTSIELSLSDMTANRNFMSTNFSNYTNITWV